MNPTEYEYAKQWIPFGSTGVFDGDSPTEYETKLDWLRKFTRRALAKYEYIKKFGLTVHDVDDMPQIMQDFAARERQVIKDSGEQLEEAGIDQE